MALTHSPRIVLGGLVLYHDAGNIKSYRGTGTTWTDLSGLNRNATLLNSTSYSSANQGTLVFDGVDDYCTISDIGSLSRFTIESWFRPTSYPNNAASTIAAVYQNGGGSVVNYKIGYESSSLMYGGFYDGGWRLTPAISTTLNTWQQIAFTYDGSNLTAYSNGSLVGSTAYVGTPTSSGSGIRIGRRWDAAEYFVGNISVTKIYNRALTAAEAQQNFSALRGRYGI